MRNQLHLDHLQSNQQQLSITLLLLIQRMRLMQLFHFGPKNFCLVLLGTRIWVSNSFSVQGLMLVENFSLSPVKGNDFGLNLMVLAYYLYLNFPRHVRNKSVVYQKHFIDFDNCFSANRVNCCYSFNNLSFCFEHPHGSFDSTTCHFCPLFRFSFFEGLGLVHLELRCLGQTGQSMTKQVIQARPHPFTANLQDEATSVGFKQASME